MRIRGRKHRIGSCHEQIRPHPRPGRPARRRAARRLDVTSDEDWAAASAEFGGIDVLVLNADVDAVADRAMRDINRRKLISTPDAAATVAWYGKRFTYPAYLGFTTLAMRYFRHLMVREYPSESGRG